MSDTNTLTDDEIDALAAAVNGMTHAPWSVGNDWTYEIRDDTAMTMAKVVGPGDARGIVALRNAAPALIAMARRARELESKAALLDSLVAHCDPDGDIPRDVLAEDVLRVFTKASQAFINERRAHERIHAMAEGVADLASAVTAEGKPGLASRLRALLKEDRR